MIVYVPLAVFEATAMVIVELPAPGEPIDGGLKVTVTPDGCPVADKEIPPSKPPETVVVIVLDPTWPRAIASEAGEAEIVKLAGVDMLASALTRFVPFGLPHPVTRS